MYLTIYLYVCLLIFFKQINLTIIFFPAKQLWLPLWDVKVWLWVKGLQVRWTRPIFKSILVWRPWPWWPSHNPHHVATHIVAAQMGCWLLNLLLTGASAVHNVLSKNSIQKERVSRLALWVAYDKMFTLLILSGNNTISTYYHLCPHWQL